MALRISSTNILMLFVISFPDISVSRSIESIGSSGYLAKEKFSGTHKLVRQISRDVNTFQNHVKMLKQVNGLKHHNVFNTHKDVGPLVYIINPLEAKVPKAYLSLNEFKQAIIDRVVRLKSHTRKNTVFWYTGKIAPTRTPFIGRNGNIDIEHNNWVRNQDLANKRPLVEREITSIKSKIDDRVYRELKKDHKDIKYTTTAITKLKLRQYTKNHKTIIKPTFRSKGIKSVLKSRNNSKSDNKRTVLRSSTVQQKITSTTMSSKINHPAIRISHASIHGTEDEINFKDNKELSKTDVKEISGFKTETTSKTREFGAIASDIKIFSEVTPKSAEFNTKLPISSIAIEVEIPSKIVTEYANTIESNKNKNSMTVNKSEVSSTVDEKEESSIMITGTEKCSKTISEMEISSTAITETEESSTAISETEESNTAISETAQSSKAISDMEESSTAADAGKSDSTTTDTDVATTAEELVTTEVETSPTETDETTTVATEEPITKRTWKPLSRPLVFMRKETRKK